MGKATRLFPLVPSDPKHATANNPTQGTRIIANVLIFIPFRHNVAGQARVLPSPGPAGWDPRPFLSSSPAPHRCLRVRCRAIGRLDHGAIMITIKITIMNGPDLPHDPNLNPNRNPFPPFRFPTFTANRRRVSDVRFRRLLCSRLGSQPIRVNP